MVASRYYHKGVFYLATKATAQEAVKKGFIVEGKYVPLKTLEELGTQVVLSPVLPYSLNWALMPFLQGLGRILSLVFTLPLGCQNSSLHHSQSFHHQVTIQLVAGAEVEGMDLHGSLPGVPQPHPLYSQGSNELPALPSP